LTEENYGKDELEMFTIYLHQTFCMLQHSPKDCEWREEKVGPNHLVKDHDFNGVAHKRWLEIAKDVLKKASIPLKNKA